MTNDLYATPTTREIAARIRHIRKSKRLTLDGVAARSNGQLKSVVLGSYERGTRAISLARAIQIAAALDVPLTHLLSDQPVAQQSLSQTLAIDLRALRERARIGAILPDEKKFLPPLLDFATWIAQRRSDWNGEILTVRKSDLETLALMSKSSEAQVLQWLEKSKLLLES